MGGCPPSLASSLRLGYNTGQGKASRAGRIAEPRNRMDRQTFIDRIQEALPVGTVLHNPGRGTSTILSYSDANIGYRRGGSRFTVSFDNLYRAYARYSGKMVSTTDLHGWAPGIFDSKQGGHSCNCTFLFMVLRDLGEAPVIRGRGVQRNPFFVEIQKVTSVPKLANGSKL